MLPRLCLCPHLLLLYYYHVVRPPSSVTVSSSPKPIFAGMSFTLACSIELLEEVASGVVLQVMWRGPDGSIPVGALDGSGTSYINTVIISATDLSSGNYICAASLNSSAGFLTSSAVTTGSLTIVVGKIFH